MDVIFKHVLLYKIKRKKSGSSKQYSNLPYIEPSDTVSGNEWCERVFVSERMCEACL